MVSEGIFQPPLKPHVYINTLRRAEAELAQMLPQQGAEEDEQADGGARWEEGAIQVGAAILAFCHTQTRE